MICFLILFSGLMIKPFFSADNLKNPVNLSGNMIDVFQIQSQACHNDTTSLSMYGDADNNNTEQCIKVTFGHSKKHRKDLKQLIWSMSVSSDHAFLMGSGVSDMMQF